MIEHYCRQCW